jgi:5-methylcytosine-specific restriction protein B
MTDTFGNDNPATSQAAHLYVTKPVPGPHRYWVMAPGQKAEYWDECHAQGIAVMGWSELGDLRDYADKEALRLRLVQLHAADTSKKNDALACW